MKQFLILLLVALISTGCGQSGPADSPSAKLESEVLLSPVNGSLVGQTV
jgi:predicted small lipoprotein YifL